MGDGGKEWIFKVWYNFTHGLPLSQLHACNQLCLHVNKPNIRKAFTHLSLEESSCLVDICSSVVLGLLQQSSSSSSSQAH